MNLKDITLEQNLLKAIKEMGYTELTPIQEKSIPEIQKGKDVIGQSSTGSGKTAAFGLPILEKVVARKGIQALVLTPTRELCVQVADSLSTFSKYSDIKVAAIYGGVGINPQKDLLKRVEVVVGTPGRILDHLRSHSIHLNSVRFFVLDETDRMCDMGFFDDVEKIIKSVPQQRQTLLFSATYTQDVDKLIHKYMNSPVTITAEKYVDPTLLEQVYYDVSPSEKFSVLLHLLNENTFGLSLVFCRTRREVDVVAKNLQKNGLHAMAIHGGLTQSKRLRALDSLKREHIDILVATDVAARGLDIKGVSYVYNYDVPPTSEEYVHRIGRTARAGKGGKAISLLSPKDHLNFRSVLRNSSLNIKNEKTPEAKFVEVQRRVERHEDRGGRGNWHSSGPRSYSSRPQGPKSYRLHSPHQHSSQRHHLRSDSGLDSGSDYRDISSGGSRGYHKHRPENHSFRRKRRD